MQGQMSRTDAKGVMSDPWQTSNVGRSRGRTKRGGQRDNYEGVRTSTSVMQNGLGQHHDKANLNTTIQEMTHQDRPERTSDVGRSRGRTQRRVQRDNCECIGTSTSALQNSLIQHHNEANLNTTIEEMAHQDQPERRTRGSCVARANPVYDVTMRALALGLMAGVERRWITPDNRNGDLTLFDLWRCEWSDDATPDSSVKPNRGFWKDE